jgi:phage tail P2-like protein
MNNQLLPPNATAHEIALAGAASRISGVPITTRTLYQPAACPAVALPALAWSFSLDQWDTNWSDAQKRSAIANSVYVHRHKGTIGAVKIALGSLGFQVQVQEWFNQLPAGAPFTFNLLLTATQTGFSQSDLVRMTDVVMATKNLRSHLAAIVPTVVTSAGPGVTAVASLGTEITIQYGATLALDGTWMLDGTHALNGVR